MADFDLAIIGGGINGVGIARDAAGRGLKVVLFEQNDLASGTSSASSKLIHGGLALSGARRAAAGARRAERARGAAADGAASDSAAALRPAARRSRAARRSCCGSASCIYDLIGRREILPGTRALDLVTDEAGQPLQARASITATNIPTVLPTIRVSSCVNARRRRRARRGNPHPHALRARRARPKSGGSILNARGERDVVTARVLINAAGAWVEMVADTVLRQAAAAAAAARQGQPYRGARVSTITTAPISCSRPTAASCSPSRSSTITR